MRRMMNGALPGLVMTVALLCAWMTPAAAQQLQNKLDTTGPVPWAHGVSPQQQQAAYQLFKAGNALLKESVFAQAIVKYREALQRWDHPAIHYNLALALMRLDQTIETHEHFLAALRHGPESLETGLYEHANNYKTLIEKQLVRLTLTCDEPGTTVTMDGRPLFVAPGRHEAMVLPGPHSIIANKAGHPLTDRSRTLTAGEQVTLNIKLDVIEYRTRWPVWMPWVVVGSGLAAGAGGALLHRGAADSYGAFDTGVLECAKDGRSCIPTQELATTRTRGDTLQRVAFGTYALGGAALVTGAVLLVLNLPQSHRIDPAQRVEPVTVTPLIGGDTNGLLATFRF
jgi:hypothetical protein